MRTLYGIFDLRKDKIYLRGTNEVLITLRISDEIEAMRNFIKEMTIEPQIHSKELDVITGYDFYSKKTVESIASDLGYTPKVLFGLLHNNELIYKEGQRFSKRFRNAELIKNTGEKQFFGIKKNAINILKGVC